jgi:hypothetical protein
MRNPIGATATAVLLGVVLAGVLGGCVGEGWISVWKYKINVTVRDKNRSIYPNKHISFIAYEEDDGRRVQGPGTYSGSGFTNSSGKISWDDLEFNLQRNELFYNEMVRIILNYQDGAFARSDSFLSSPSIVESPDQGPKTVNYTIRLENEEKP